jgi:hypothetical protein
MEKGRPLLRWAGILLVCAAISIFCIEAQGEKEPAKAPATARPDLVTIETLAAFGKLELPAVSFLHDRHTDVLLKEKKDCKTCHPVEDGKLSLAFKRKKGAKAAEIKSLYHSGCIGCHRETAGAGKKTGPLDGACRSCHNAKPAVASNRLDVGLDKVLHFRHVDAKAIPSNRPDLKDNCVRCHHEYDKQAKKTFYAKGKEGTCRYCHLAKPKEDVKSMEQASHNQCVVCHLDLAGKGVKETGPFLCAGCHGAEGQALVARKNIDAVAKLENKEVPRIKREQPDVALIMLDPVVEAGKLTRPLVMNPVAFNHKAHEKYNDTCRVCHHAGMDACAKKCHTLNGAKDGEFVRLEQAMHLRASSHSCVGCHARKQAVTVCAGCHNHMDKARRPNDAACKTCHLPLPDKALPADAVPTKEQKAAAAETLLKARNMNVGTFAVDDIPEKVTIKTLADQYEPAELPHRKIVLTLMKNMKENPLAGYFHFDQGTICQGCHHNSPAGKKPPRCGNCHGKPFDARQPNRPGLQAAFHGQCMGCHKDMALKKPAATACTECHKEKKK